MPTPPLPSMTRRSDVPSAEEDAILKNPPELLSIPTVHLFVAPDAVENSIAASAAFAKIESCWFGVVVPIPTLPADVTANCTEFDVFETTKPGVEPELM